MEQPLISQDDEVRKSERKPTISTLITTAFESYKSKPISYWILLILSTVSALFGLLSTTLLQRYYYLNGGKNKIIMWGAVASGWPLTAFILLTAYIITKTPPSPLTSNLTFSYIGLGILNAFSSLLYTYAYAYLPSSTASILGSTVLVFSALSGHFLVRNNIKFPVLNAIVIITSTLIIIGLDSKSDGNKSTPYYMLGFICEVFASAAQGLSFALSELVFVKLQGRRSFLEVLEQRTLVLFFGFLFTSVFVVASNGFEGLKDEAINFEGGVKWYFCVLVLCSVLSQLGVVGSFGALFLSSTVFAGVLTAIRVPLTSVAAVIIFSDPMSGFKILSVFLTCWGFCSYIYGNL